MTREQAYRLRDMIRKASASLDDADALEAVELFAPWQSGVAYVADQRLRYGDKLYRVVQAHTSQAEWLPDATPALYTQIVVDPEAGTRENPIEYSGNMVLEQGKYYTQDGVIYLCTRDTVNPVYHALKDLVGLYVEIAE